MTEAVVITGRIQRRCYACYDFEPSGDRTCVVCGLPVGLRLPEADRPSLADLIPFFYRT